MDQNVKVAVRVRPLSQKEINRGCKEVVSCSGKQINVAGETKDDTKNFTFDFCYDASSTQIQVFDDIAKPVLMKALDGFNGTVFAYGQTGSGKTHSMMGAPGLPGIIPLLNGEIFRRVDERVVKMTNEAPDGTEINVRISVSFLEIYNEIVKDLLNPSDKALQIREDPGKGIYVQNLCELIVQSEDDVLRLIEQGNQVRRVAATKMNESSSRSHSCFTIQIEYRTVSHTTENTMREKFLRAKLNLVDLAGSERANKTGATGSTLKEGANINRSLMALGNVINALAESGRQGKKHIPYRDSKLTRLLQESLGGNAATTMLAAVSPADYNYDETVSTLRYANRAKSIENAAVRNEDQTEKEIRNLKDEIAKLKAALAGSDEGAIGSGDPELEKKLKDMEEQQRSAWEEKALLSRQLEEERKRNFTDAIGGMINDVKAKKIEHMKTIKRLDAQKAKLRKQQQQAKHKGEDLKKALEDDMTVYQQLKKEYEETEGESDADAVARHEEIHDGMTSVLASIEKKRGKWHKSKEAMKNLKTSLDDLEDEITDARADLVSTAGILDQNDALRAKISEEERSKALKQLEDELASARQALGDEVRSEVQEEMSALRATVAEQTLLLAQAAEQRAAADTEITALGQFSDELEARLAEAEVNNEASLQDVDALTERTAELERELAAANLAKESFEKKFELQQGERVGAASSSSERDFKLFKSMMDAFDDEKRVMNEEYISLKNMLSKATEDIVYLSTANDDLRRALHRAVRYEPHILPSKNR
jgi:hypothetical protein